MKRLAIFAMLGLGSLLTAQTVPVVSSHFTNSAGSPLSGYVYFQPVNCLGGYPMAYRMPGGGTVMPDPVQVTVTAGAMSVTLPDTTLTYPANICFAMSYPGGNLPVGYGLLQPHGTAYNAGDWCQVVNGSIQCNLDNYTPGNQPLPTTNAVQAINYTGGMLTFTGPGISQTGNTFYFGGGSGGMVYPTFTGLTAYNGLYAWTAPTFAMVTALWASGSCSGYLKSDGTCSIPPNAVTSVFGRTGAVAAAANDYSFNQISGSLLHSQLPALQSSDIPNNAANTTGNASTATALATTPAQCTSGQYATGIAAAGTANCSQVQFSQVGGTPSTTQVPVQSLTTIGTSGAATLIGGVLNIPQYGGGSGSGTVNDCLTPGAVGYYIAAGTTINCDISLLTDGDGNMQAASGTFGSLTTPQQITGNPTCIVGGCSGGVGTLAGVTPVLGKHVEVADSTANPRSCTVGGGSTHTTCYYNGSAWIPLNDTTGATHTCTTAITAMTIVNGVITSVTCP